MNMKIEKGTKAPALELISAEMEKVKVPSGQKDHTLLLFFPFAFSGGCTTELCGVRDSLKDYENLETEVFGISVDSPFALKAFKDSQDLNFSLLSDFNKEAARAYGALYEEFALGMQGVAKRSAFVIDKKGEIRYAEVLEDAGDTPNFNAIQSTLEKLK
jgi:peroxiredoxin